jgi:hypothetical protein
MKIRENRRKREKIRDMPIVNNLLIKMDMLKILG